MDPIFRYWHKTNDLLLSHDKICGIWFHKLTFFIYGGGGGGGWGFRLLISFYINPLSTRPHQNVVWYNNSWLGLPKTSELCTKRKKNILQKMSPHLSQLNVAMAHRNYFRQNNLWILKLATYIQIEDHYSRCKLATFLDWKGLPNVQILFCLHIKFYWFVMKIKKFMLPIWWYNRGSFPLGNKYFGVFVLNGIMEVISSVHYYCSCMSEKSLSHLIWCFGCFGFDSWIDDWTAENNLWPCSGALWQSL